MLMKVVKCPSDNLSKTNCAIVNAADLPNITCVKITVDDVNTFVLSVKSSSNLNRNEIGFSALHRKWLDLVLMKEIDVVPFEIDPSKRLISMTIEIDFLRRTNQKPETYNADEMAADFLDQFSGILFSTKQLLAFDYKGKLFTVLVHELEAINIQDVVSGSSKPQKVLVGLLNRDTTLIINKNENCYITLIGKSTGAQVHQSIIAPDFDFNELGIGGLDKEFAEVFRRAFSSRMFSSNIVEQCGGKHVKGIMLYGPPGTGKTLIARKIGGMLRSHPPKVINGPEILNKFVGESEANIRRLFADAEDEEKRLGPASALHIIIFDEIDAICKQRATTGGGTGVHDTVVNQLLSKIDGVEQLNNVLIIGMTNRLDLIDDALLRPGRFEVKLQIGLPDEKGRLQILKIHTAKMLKNNRLAADVDLEDLAKRSKNFTGAEIEALTRAALSIALNRVIKVTSKVEIDYEAADNLQINHSDFLLALENDVKPAFGTNSQFLDKFAANPFYNFSPEIVNILNKCHLAIKSLQQETKSAVYSILLEGDPNCGKTTLACKIALNAAFPFFKVCTLMDMLGFSENSKCLRIQKIFDDAYKSSLSCVLINDIENLIDYGPIGPRYSTVLLKNFEEILKNIPPKNHRLLIIATTESKLFLKELKLIKRFSNIFHVPNVTNLEELMLVLEETLLFDSSELEEIRNELKFHPINIGIKKLLTIINTSQQDVHKVDQFVQMFKVHDDEDD